MREEKLSRLSATNISKSHPDYLHYKYYHSDLFDCLKKYSSGNLLDIGCGNKPYYIVVKEVTISYTGCDIVQSSEEKVDILCEATNIPLPSESFDTVISTQTIEHVADHQSLVNESFRLVKNGGFFILSGPMYWPLHEEPYDFFRFTKHGFRYILEKAGFEIVEERSNGGMFALCGQVLIQTFFTLNKNKSFTLKLLKRMMKYGGILLINSLFGWLDDKLPQTKNTMNYVFVAQKNLSTTTEV